MINVAVTIKNSKEDDDDSNEADWILNVFTFFSWLDEFFCSW